MNEQNDKEWTTLILRQIYAVTSPAFAEVPWKNYKTRPVVTCFPLYSQQKITHFLQQMDGLTFKWMAATLARRARHGQLPRLRGHMDGGEIRDRTTK